LKIIGIGEALVNFCGRAQMLHKNHRILTAINQKLKRVFPSVSAGSHPLTGKDPIIISAELAYLRSVANL
jgi:hypothetical protein